MYQYANIQVIDSNDGFFTKARLSSYNILMVSINDIVEHFPEQDTEADHLHCWLNGKSQHWWSQFFSHLDKGMTNEISELILKKPIFLMENASNRGYLPRTGDGPMLLFINADPSVQIWRSQLIILNYQSQSERSALLSSNQVQLLDEERLIEIIRQDHLKLAQKSPTIDADPELMKQIWSDLLYLRSRISKWNNSMPLLVPIIGPSPNIALITYAFLPTIFGINIQNFTKDPISHFVQWPDELNDGNRLENHLTWEYFLLLMGCKTPAICLKDGEPVRNLPLLPAFSMYADEKWIKMAEFIFSKQLSITQDCLGQFPIVANTESGEEIYRVSVCFAASIASDLLSLPRIDIPPYCLRFATELGVCAEYNHCTTMNILKLLGENRIQNLDLYVEWLGRLQLEIRDESNLIDYEELRRVCRLYLPEKGEFCTLQDLLVMPDVDHQYNTAITAICKSLNLKHISVAKNQVYWQFQRVFQKAGCRCTLTVRDICLAIGNIINDTEYFIPIGDARTILNENGFESLICIFKFLEHCILDKIKTLPPESRLYQTLIEDRDSAAVVGGEKDLLWRLNLYDARIWNELQGVCDIQGLSIPLIKMNRQLVDQNDSNKVYACFELQIIRHLENVQNSCCFVSMELVQLCPLVLAALDFDYLEREAYIQWTHQNNNLENQLTRLTEIFREVLDDQQVEVVSSFYASISIILLNRIRITHGDRQNDRMTYNDYPFLIFNKVVLLCGLNYSLPQSNLAAIPLLALATLLHKRKNMPFEEAKLRARQEISRCDTFLSKIPAQVASAPSTNYPLREVLFPKHDQLVESITVSLGNISRVENDVTDLYQSDTGINPSLLEQDAHYRERAPNQNHRSLAPRSEQGTITVNVVDPAEAQRIGRNAEHFFFRYLQSLYGNDVAPTMNWRSSARSFVFPNFTRNIDDSIGYDFILHDIKEKFARGNGLTTKRCYFEVKGTAGAYEGETTIFHVSANEFKLCQNINSNGTRKQEEAYFICLIQYCLDPQRISLANFIDWYLIFYHLVSIHTNIQNSLR